MKVPRHKISNVIAERTLSKGVSKKTSLEIAAYLLDCGRVGELNSIMRDVQAAWAEAGYVDIIASSAHPLTSVTDKEIRDTVKRYYPKAKKIAVTSDYEPRVIGGVKIQMANQQLDLSVEAKLNKFRRLTASGKE